MYPRNAASPERIAVGAVVLIADGTVQTSGVAITVRGQGGAEAGSAGTIAYGASGIVYYTPTQGETDFTSFTVIASKASCIPVAITIITSASATPGYAGVDWSFVANKTATNDLAGTNIKTNQVVASVTGAVGSVTGLTASNLDTTISSRMATYSQPTGFLAATFPAGTIASTTNITGGTITTTTNLTTNNDKTGYALSATGSAAMTEDYAADGATFTLNQGVYMIWSLLAERSRSSTTLTSKKLDGSTTAMTFTLDSATAPSSQTRAT